ncbi:MAG: hypothetical protein J5742_00370 [Alphaproteobacteria bacterium]|nr:hypothetical protein [Alphaproteobacteria bacterium]
MQFKPNLNLLNEWRDAEHAVNFASNTAFISVFKRDNKTLVYMCDRHKLNISFNMVDMCFADDFGVKPDVLLTEMENDGFKWKLNWHGLQDNTLAYAAAVAAKRNLPIVFADLSDDQMVKVINRGFLDNKITVADLGRVLGKSGGPDSHGNLDQQMLAYLDRFGRNPFMLQNIAAALNKYDTVFCIFGIGHYECQRSALEDMLGKPEYITQIKNMRGDFSNLNITPMKLYDFEQPNTMGVIINDKNKTFGSR